jgi:hypothetical protein
MIAKLENDIINVYDKNNALIGGIKTHSHFKNGEIIIGDTAYRITRNKRKIEISDNNKVIYHLKIDPFWGSLKIKETGYNIKGVFSLKWGTKMVNKEGGVLVKIKNQNIFFNNNKYDIKLMSNNVSDLDILVALFGHLYGSHLKLNSHSVS